MDDRDPTLVNLDGIQRLRDRARLLKELILNAGTGGPKSPRGARIQQAHEERTSAYVEIRPRGGRYKPSEEGS